MTKLLTSFILCFCLLSTASAQNYVEFNANDNWVAYMNVFQLPANGGGYEFGSAWALADVKSTLDVANNQLILQPNFSTYNATDAYWVDPTTMLGNKNMEALTFVEPGNTFNNQDLTFSGYADLSSLDSAYTAYYFIKALDPNNDYADALNGSKVFELSASSNFSVSATAAELATGLVIQYGFIIVGINANPTTENAIGSVTISPTLANTNAVTDLGDAISVNPNPATNQLSIDTDLNVATYEIFNLSGQLVKNGGNEKIIDIANLQSGLFLLVTKLEDGRKSIIKFIKE